MEYNSYLQNCGNDDVISFGSQMYKLGQVKQAFESAFTGKIADVLIESLESQGINGISIYTVPSRGSGYRNNRMWFSEGKDCEILRIGAKGWQKGQVRIRVTLEFYPDEPEVEETQASNEISEPESPLDDLRQMINQEAKQQNQ
jgi:hypothetical protein